MTRLPPLAAFLISALLGGCGPEGLTGAASSEADVASPTAYRAYVASSGGHIYQYRYVPKTPALTLQASFDAKGPSGYLAMSADKTHLYSTSASGTVAFAVNASTGALTFLNQVSAGGAYVSLDQTGKWLFTASYQTGVVTVFAVGTDGRIGAQADVQTPGVKAHQVRVDPTNTFVFVPCLGSDYVAQLSFNVTTGKLTPNPVPHFSTKAGAGPRHLVFHPNGTRAYLVNETNSTVQTLAYDSVKGQLSSLQTLTTLPAGFTGANKAAEVAVHPSGKFLFVSNRGADDVGSFSINASTGQLTALSFGSARGKTPRHFSIDPPGTHLLIGDQDSGQVTALKIDTSTGLLTQAPINVSVPAPMFVQAY